MKLSPSESILVQKLKENEHLDYAEVWGHTLDALIGKDLAMIHLGGGCETVTLTEAGKRAVR